MGDLALIIRLVLATVFAVAAVAKLADRGGSRDALRGFGIPAALTGPLAVLLPCGELAIAAALTVPATERWAALAALVLLLSFAAAIAINLWHGRTPPCHCFGRLHTAPTGPSTLVRTGALAALAGAVVANQAGRPFAPVAALSGADALVAGLGVLAAGAAAFAALLAQNGRLLVRVEALERRLASEAQTHGAGVGNGLPVGAPAPAFALDDPDGPPTTLDDLRADGRPILLFFSDPGCGPCRALRADIAAWRRVHAGALEIVVLERRRDVAHAYDAHATPTAVLVRPDGTIGSPPAIGAVAITELVQRTAGRDAATAHPLAA